MKKNIENELPENRASFTPSGRISYEGWKGKSQKVEQGESCTPQVKHND